jgi:hypothetical protein
VRGERTGGRKNGTNTANREFINCFSVTSTWIHCKILDDKFRMVGRNINVINWALCLPLIHGRQTAVEMGRLALRRAYVTVCICLRNILNENCLSPFDICGAKTEKYMLSHNTHT